MSLVESRMVYPLLVVTMEILTSAAAELRMDVGATSDDGVSMLVHSITSIFCSKFLAKTLAKHDLTVFFLHESSTSFIAVSLLFFLS